MMRETHMAAYMETNTILLPNTTFIISLTPCTE